MTITVNSSSPKIFFFLLFQFDSFAIDTFVCRMIHEVILIVNSKSPNTLSGFLTQQNLKKFL